MWSFVHVAVTVQRPFNWTTCSSEAVLKRKENFKLETTIFSHHKKLYPSVLSGQDYCYWGGGGGGDCVEYDAPFVSKLVGIFR